MVAKSSLAVICAMMFMVAACDLGAPTVPPPEQGAALPNASASPPATSLTPEQVYGVLGCERTIQYQGAQFTGFKESQLNQCFDGVLEVQLAFENGQIDSSGYNEELSEARSNCARDFKAIGGASTRLVNSIVGACGPVQDLILPDSGYDPLQFGALTRAQNLVLIGDATGLAGRICGAKELLVDALEAIQVPRMVGLLKILDNGTGQFAVAGPTSSLLPASTIPNIPLDSRCIFPTLR